MDQSYPDLCNVLEDYQEFFNSNASCKFWPDIFYETGQIPSKDLKNELYKYGKDNLALVHVLIQSPFLTKIKRDVAISFTSYVANTGGLLGLCLGKDTKLHLIHYHLNNTLLVFLNPGLAIII